MACFVKIEEVIDADYPLYAHWKDDADKETLKEHLNRCQKYFELLETEKGLSNVVERFALQLIPNATSEIFGFIYKMFCQVIIFHDFGKINPAKICRCR